MKTGGQNLREVEQQLQDSGEAALVESATKPASTQLARRQNTLPVMGNVDINALLEKAVDAKAAVEVMKELRVMANEMRAEQAKADFDEAMSAFQAECPVITKDKGVPDKYGKTAYKYAPIESIEVQIRPLLRKHGFSHTFDTDTSSAAGWVIAKCIVTHTSGHSRESVAKFPLGTKTQIMSDTQVYAAALTFANRRALTNAYGLILAGEDLDGQTGKIKPAGPSSRAPDNRNLKPYADALWKLLTPECPGVATNWDTRHQWLWKNEILDGAVPETVQSLDEARFKEVIEAVEKKLGGAKA